MATTAAQLIAGAKELADLSSSAFVSDANWLIWINQGVRELHGLLASHHQDTFWKEKTFTLTSTAAGAVYTLPSDFLSVRGLDYNPGTANREVVHRFNFGERNAVGVPLLSSVVGFRRRYRVVNRQTLVVDPYENAGGNYKLIYVPRATEVTTSGTPVDLADELEPWAEYPMVTAAVKALQKEQMDASELMAKRDLMRLDIEQSAQTDEAEPDTITDVQTLWPFWRRC